MAVQRYDAGEVRGYERTPQGGLRVVGAVARTGVLPYETPDGRTIREYVAPEVLFAADSLASLRGAPVTDLHPPEMVTADNWKTYSVGNIGDAPRRDGELLVADVLVQDAAEVARVEARERRELSCGYVAEIDPTPGVSPAGEHYDQAQTSRFYNHVGLGPPGWGRAGPSVALRMDAAGHALPNPSATAVTRLDTSKETPAMKTVLKIAGREYVLRADALEGDAAAAQGAVDAGSSAITAQLEATKQALADAMGELAKLQAKIAADEATEASAPVTEDMVPEAVLDSALAKREALRADARVVLGAEVKLDGLKPGEIKAKVITHLAPSVKLDGLSKDAIEGMYVMAVAGAKTAGTGEVAARNDALDRARAAAEGHRADGGAEPGDPADVMATNRETQREAARKKAQ